MPYLHMLMCHSLCVIMGDSRKYSYHTTGGILEFRRRGGVSWNGIPKAWGGGGNAVWSSKGMGRVGFSSEFSEFPEGRRQKLHLKSLSGLVNFPSL